MKKTAQYYATHPLAKKKKKAYDVAYKRRKGKAATRSSTELQAKRRAAIKRGVDRKGKDFSHTKNGIVLKSTSANRGSKTDSAGDRRARGTKR